MLLKKLITASNFIQERGRKKPERQTERYLKDRGKENSVTLCLLSVGSGPSVKLLKERRIIPNHLSTPKSHSSNRRAHSGEPPKMYVTHKTFTCSDHSERIR